MKGFYMMMIFRKRFVQVSYWYAIQEKISSEFFRLSKRVCKLYNTFKKFENDKDNGSDQNAMSETKKKIAEFNAKKAGATE